MNGHKLLKKVNTIKGRSDRVSGYRVKGLRGSSMFCQQKRFLADYADSRGKGLYSFKVVGLYLWKQGHGNRVAGFRVKGTMLKSA